MSNPNAIQECVTSCLSCYAACVSATKDYRSDKEDDATLFSVLSDCALVCQTTANFLLRGSDAMGWMCAVNARICDRCARECGRQQLFECATACRECAALCHKLARVPPSAV